MTPVRAFHVDNSSHDPEPAYQFTGFRTRHVVGGLAYREEPTLIELVVAGGRGVADQEAGLDATVTRLPLPARHHAEEDSELSAREFVEQRGLKPALRTCHELLTQVFGPAARLSIRLDSDRETGERKLVAEARYGITEDDVGLDELAERDEEFLTRYIRDVPADDRRRIVLVRLPGNGD